MFGVALFQRGEQRIAKAAYLATEFQRLLNQEQTADGADGLVHAADNGSDIDPRCCRLDQHARINRWVVQSERTNNALDIHAVANFEEPVGDSVPIAQQLVVGRNTEIESTPNTKKRAGIPAAAPRPRIRSGEVEWKLALQVHERVNDWSEAILIEM